MDQPSLSGVDRRHQSVMIPAAQSMLGAGGVNTHNTLARCDNACRMCSSVIYVLQIESHGLSQKLVKYISGLVNFQPTCNYLL